MMEGGPALSYLMHLNPNSKIILTGFAVEGTNSWRLMNTGKIKKDEYELDVELPVEYLDFSAHASHSELLEFVKKANPKKIVLVHGDKETMHALQKELKEKGYDAVIPKFGEKLEI